MRARCTPGKACLKIKIIRRRIGVHGGEKIEARDRSVKKARKTTR
jgi:hypothetical protein